MTGMPSGEFVMGGQGVPVSEAAMQFFVEALRANTSVLEQVNKTMTLQQQELKEQLALITDVRERVIRIEALPQFGAELNELRKDVTQLQMKQAQDEMKSQTWTWIVRYVPSLAAIIVTIIASVMIILIASGRVVIPTADTRQAEFPASRAPSQDEKL